MGKYKILSHETRRWREKKRREKELLEPLLEQYRDHIFSCETCLKGKEWSCEVEKELNLKIKEVQR